MNGNRTGHNIVVSSFTVPLRPPACLTTMTQYTPTSQYGTWVAGKNLFNPPCMHGQAFVLTKKVSTAVGTAV